MQEGCLPREIRLLSYSFPALSGGSPRQPLHPGTEGLLGYIHTAVAAWVYNRGKNGEAAGSPVAPEESPCSVRACL